MLRNIKALYRLLQELKLDEYQKEHLVKQRLRVVLISAYNYVPYYKKIMDCIGYNPMIDFTGPDDLKKLPILTKEILKKHDISYFLKKGARTTDLFSDSTSGSTGIPFKIYRNWDERSYQVAKWLRVFFVNGYSIRDKVLSLTSPGRLGEGKTFIQKFGILRRLALDYLLPAEKVTDIFLDYGPEVFYGNRSHLDLVAMELIKRKIKPKGLKLVVVGAEIIHPSSQRLYKRAFGMEAIEVYGSAEMGTLAYGTQQKNGLKLCDDLTFFEFLDKDDKPVLDMKPARIIVTDLMNKTMPFIRYEQGDLAVANKISIKAPYHERRILKIIGRDDDNLVLPDGSIRPFHDFYEIFDKYLEVKQFRIIQTEIDKITIQISSEPIYFKKNKTLMLEDLKKNFPPGISFSFENVDYLNPDPDGKLRVLISKLK